ncbi:hypothetical protein DPMN_067749 [Dreissena polymorpha]|uniref:Uncharacterized protein n=1 Tax=Dreissena polymorpha TaxID=45954 RepID=A0A9D4BTS9_DREPO|nr:hypothetical protein DPMN_067749 [Dreissena polymorpha]
MPPFSEAQTVLKTPCCPTMTCTDKKKGSCATEYIQYSYRGTNIIRGYATARLLVRGGRIVCSRGVSPWHSASIRATTPNLC